MSASTQPGATTSSDTEARRLDGIGTFLTMLGRVASPVGAWSDGPQHRESAVADVLRVTAAAMPQAHAVSLTHITARRSSTVAATSAAGSSADAAQHATAQGPLIDAVTQQRTVSADDLRRDGRWPQLAELAERITARSVISVPLAEIGLRNAALNVYSEQPGAWPQSHVDESLADVVLAGARLALNALRRQDRIDNLELALDSNRIIGAAVGIVMARERCTYEDAFTRLTTISQTQNIKMRALAEDLVQTGALPGADRIGDTTGPLRHPDETIAIASASRYSDEAVRRVITASAPTPP